MSDLMTNYLVLEIARCQHFSGRRNYLQVCFVVLNPCSA